MAFDISLGGLKASFGKGIDISLVKASACNEGWSREDPKSKYDVPELTTCDCGLLFFIF